MLPDELLFIHDQLHIRASPRPWVTVIEKICDGFIFWARRAESPIIFDNENDARYLTFIRNLTPELVNEVRSLRHKIVILEEKIIKFERGIKNE